MSDSFDNLRRKILRAVEDQRLLPHNAEHREQHVLAEFIRLRLAKANVSENQFCQTIQLSADQTALLLQGTLSDQALTDDLLQRIAQAIGCEANLLYIMLNRPSATSIRAEDNLIEVV